MSHNIADHRLQPTTQIANRLNHAKRQQGQDRALQLQGNQALQLHVEQGWFEIAIPTTPTTQSGSFYIHTENHEVIMLANLMYSVYYPEYVGFDESPSAVIFRPKDAGDMYPRYLSFECFLSYDDREEGSDTLANEQEVLDTAVDAYAVRLTARLRSNTTWSLPAGASDRLWIYYQIRATLAEGGT